MSKKTNVYHLYRLDKKNKISKLNSLELKSERKDIQQIFDLLTSYCEKLVDEHS